MWLICCCLTEEVEARVEVSTETSLVSVAAAPLPVCTIMTSGAFPPAEEEAAAAAAPPTDAAAAAADDSPLEAASRIMKAFLGEVKDTDRLVLGPACCCWEDPPAVAADAAAEVDGPATGAAAADEVLALSSALTIISLTLLAADIAPIDKPCGSFSSSSRVTLTVDVSRDLTLAVSHVAAVGLGTPDLCCWFMIRSKFASADGPAR